MQDSNLFYIDIPAEVLKTISAEIAIGYKIIPVAFINGSIEVATSTPHDTALINDLIFLTGRNIILVFYPESEIIKAIEKHYKIAVTKLKKESKHSEFQVVEKDNIRTESNFSEKIDDINIIKLVNKIITDAINSGASDIHIEPYENELRVRYRLDGVLHETAKPPIEKKFAIISRIKIMAEIDIAEKRRPQDGRIRVISKDTNGKDKVIDVRVSTIPTDFGEKIVLRILDKSQLNLDLAKLGFEEDQLKMFKNVIESPYGMILVTGPTGSGKTTTLYAALNYLNNSEVNILTIEDPIEYNLPGINQMHVRSDIGVTFATGLRSFLRQDPDIIMVGEIRDSETAEIAIRSALTGHLVMSTLHTNDAPSAITRLLDMGIEPFLVASSVRLVMAQRLVRKLCEYCKKESNIIADGNPSTRKDERLHNTGYNMQAVGCEKCSGTGYKGRIAVFEMMPISEKISEMILHKRTAFELKEQTRKEGMETLQESGMEKIKQGITTMEEILREII